MCKRKRRRRTILKNWDGYSNSSGRRYGGKGSACGANLGLKQGLAGWSDHAFGFVGHSSVDGGGCLLLPSSGFGCVFFGVCVRWVGADPLCQFCPVKGCRPCSWSTCAAPAAAWMPVFFVEGVGGAPRSAQHSVGVAFGALALVMNFGACQPKISVTGIRHPCRGTCLGTMATRGVAALGTQQTSGQCG